MCVNNDQFPLSIIKQHNLLGSLKQLIKECWCAVGTWTTWRSMPREEWECAFVLHDTSLNSWRVLWLQADMADENLKSWEWRKLLHDTSTPAQMHTYANELCTYCTCAQKNERSRWRIPFELLFCKYYSIFIVFFLFLPQVRYTVVKVINQWRNLFLQIQHRDSTPCSR